MGVSDPGISALQELTQFTGSCVLADTAGQHWAVESFERQWRLWRDLDELHGPQRNIGNMVGVCAWGLKDGVVGVDASQA